MSATNKAVKPPSGKDNGRRNLRFKSGTRNAVESKVANSRSGISSSSINNPSRSNKKLWYQNTETNLRQWSHDTVIELGPKYGAMVTSVFKMKHHRVELPKRFMKAEKMLFLAEEAEKNTQMADGVDAGDVKFNFPRMDIDDVIELFDYKSYDIWIFIYITYKVKSLSIKD